jgi:CRP-like cAMP-binding protein
MPEAPDLESLRSVPLFAELSEDERARVCRLAFARSYRPGATLFLEGMPGEVLYVVLKGRVDLFKRQAEGEVKLASLGPGDFLGEMSLIDDALRSASAKVVEDSKLLVVTRKCFYDMLGSAPRIASKLLMHFLKVMSGRLRQTDKRFER